LLIFGAGLFFLLAVSYENGKNHLSHIMLDTQAINISNKKHWAKQTKKEKKNPMQINLLWSC